MINQKAIPDNQSDNIDEITPSTKQLKLTWEQASTWSKRSLKISSILGIALTLLYFIKYHFSPIDNLSSIGAIAILVASIAGMLALALLGSWATPALIFNFIASERQGRGLFSWIYKPNAPSKTILKRPTVISFRRVFIFSIGLFTFPWITIFSFLTKDFFGSDLHLWFATASGLIAIVLLAPFVLARPSKENINTPYWFTIFLRIIGIPIIIFLSTAPLAVIGLLIKAASLDKEATSIGALYFFAIGISWMTLTSAINLFLAFEPLRDRQAPWIFQTAVSFFSLFLLISVMGVQGGLLDKVMDIASIRLPHAQIALSAEGCKVLELYTRDSATQSASKPVLDRKDGESCLLSGVTVVSRLGDSWRIGCPAMNGKGNPSEFISDRKGVVISARHVEGWVSAASTAKSDPRIEKICAGLD